MTVLYVLGDCPEFSCTLNRHRKCVPHSSRCDGVVDCDDGFGEDELYCRGKRLILLKSTRNPNNTATKIIAAIITVASVYQTL